MYKNRVIGLLNVLFFICVFAQKAFSGGVQFDQETLIAHVQNCISMAERRESKLDRGVLRIEGMSGSKTRHLLNNLCSLKGASYLEIGCFKGSTLISAVYHNQYTLFQATGIDNWSEFTAPRNEFIRNINHYLDVKRLRVIENDCFSIDVAQAFPDPVTIYFYDGNHAESSQKAAYTHFNEVLSPVFITVIDDWNWEHVRTGTYLAFNELNYEILFEKEFYTQEFDHKTWWNGMYVAVIKKR